MFKARFISILVFFGVYLGAQENRQFIRLEEHNLSNHAYNLVPAVQDSLGYVWISNVFGINKFNGFAHEFIPFQEIFGWESKGDEIEQLVTTPSGHLLVSSYEGFLALKNENDTFYSLSIANGPFDGYAINQMIAGDDRIWLITRDGQLLSYDSEKQEVIPLGQVPDFKRDRDKMTGMAIDSKGLLYLSTNSGRLFTYDTTERLLEEIDMDIGDAFVYFTDITLDKQENLWICTSSKEVGIKIYNPQEKDFIQDRAPLQGVLRRAKGTFYKILAGSNGTLWLASDGDGLFGIDVKEMTLNNYRFDVNNQRSISSNVLLDLFEDAKGNLWVFHTYGKIDILPGNTVDRRIITEKGKLNDSDIIVQSTLRSKDGSLWLGTDGQGLVKVSPDGQTKEQYLINEDFSQGFLVQSIAEDRNGILWVATINDGVWLFDPHIKKASRFPIVDAEGLRATAISLVYADHQGRIWVSVNNGMVIYDSNYHPIAKFGTDDFEGDVHCVDLVRTGDGNLWLGLRSGLYRFNENRSDLLASTFTRFPFFDEDEEDGQGLRIRKLATDGQSKIWLVTNHFQLHGFDYLEKTYFPFKPELGIQRPLFQSIQVQDSSNIWAGANEGLWHFNLTTGNHKRYDERDGFLDSRFLSSSYKDSIGRLYFSSTRGMNYFDPKILFKSETDAQLHISAIDILGKPAIEVIPDQLTQGVPKIDQVRLDHNQSSFSFTFQALDDILAPNYNYSYLLKGFDEGWQNANSSRIANYTNIPSGDYEFVVRAGNELGVWNLGEKAIGIHIDRPPYLQWWALMLYGLVLLGMGLAVFRWALLKRNLAQEKMAHQRDAEVYDMKMNFFAKLSHEIQTPLTLMLLPLDELMEQSFTKGNKLVRKRLEMIAHNAKRLSRIVFELTTIRNQELEKTKLTVSQNDLVAHVKVIAASFEPMAKRKTMNFAVDTDISQLQMQYDGPKIEHVVYNLLSNAFRFTPDGGTIKIKLRTDDTGNAILEVQDTGRGIPPEELEHIFELFYQAVKNSREGMGIGLALSNELIELHGGTLAVRSKEGMGSSFIVTLPIYQEVETEGLMPLEASVLEDSRERLAPLDGSLVKANMDWTVLIVEDDLDLGNYIAAELENHYSVKVADNGEQGFLLAKKHLPNLILSDVMMPKVDGVELTKKLQRDKLTAHIPIVLLTADSSDVTRVSALRSGVIEYLSKPFSMNELLLKVHNIMAQNFRARQKGKTDSLLDPIPSEIKSKDELLLEKVTMEINRNMADPEFNLESLASQLNMSHSTLFRRFQGLTGQTLVDFVRTTRLKKAAQFLVEGNYTVAEAAYAVGFNDVKYFSKCFKRIYGMGPAAFKKQQT